jgi:hypothetical protein
MKAIVLAVGMMTIFGSSSVLASTRSDHTKSFPLQTLKIFEFKDQHRISRDPLANNAIWANEVKDALRKDLAGHGYVETTAGPDVYIALLRRSPGSLRRECDGLPRAGVSPPRLVGMAGR